MIERSGGRDPASSLDPARLRFPIRIRVTLSLVIIIARIRRPIGVDLRIEGPIGNVDAVDGIGEGATLERVRRKPTIAIPTAHRVAHVCLRQFEFEQAFWPNRRLDFVVGDERRRPAELATLGDARRVEHGDRLTTLAFHGSLFRLPAAPVLAHRVQRGGEIVLLRIRAFARQRRREDGAAKRTNQRLFGGVPFHRAATGRTRLLFPGRYFRHT